MAREKVNTAERSKVFAFRMSGALRLRIEDAARKEKISPAQFFLHLVDHLFAFSAEELRTVSALVAEQEKTLELLEQVIKSNQERIEKGKHLTTIQEEIYARYRQRYINVKSMVTAHATKN